MSYDEIITYDDVVEKIGYDQDTGMFWWKINAAKNIRAGSEAGCVKACRSNKNGIVSYRYIRIDGKEIPAARIAWLICHGEWPVGRISFVDDDPLNLRIKNLQMLNFVSQKYDHNDPDDRKEYFRQSRIQNPREWKDADLQRNFGITLQEYIEIAMNQNNKCAICCMPETEMRNGKFKALAVDHNHKNGKVRGLLCTACNQGIGKLKDDPKILRKAADYLEKHNTGE